jgi:5-methyltetrahydrofolate--homocysteine methyltransferase
MIIIGEKINGTIVSVKQAIMERNAVYIEQLARKQAAAGAAFLDVYAGTSPDREPEDLKWLINVVENAVETPLCVDSRYPQTLVDVLPYVKRPGLINAVTDEAGVPAAIFPLVKQYNCGVVALTLDQHGIPKSVQARVKITEKLIHLAKCYQIDKDRIYVDPLVTSLAADSESFKVFIETVKTIKMNFPSIKIISGLSNISACMPRRKFINRSFLVLAMQAGMDSAILDPLDTELMGLVYAVNTMLGQDNFTLKYIRAFRKGLLG